MSIFADEFECCLCHVKFQQHSSQPILSIPLFEDIPVLPDFPGESASFPACLTCYDKYECGEVECWGNDRLMEIQKRYVELFGSLNPDTPSSEPKE